MNKRERKFYKKNLKQVLHTTLNPYQPGVVRIHLVPAKYKPFGVPLNVVILNGKRHTTNKTSMDNIISSIYRKEVNQFKGKEVTEKDLEKVVEKQ